jgi:hypothetical protein
MRHKMRYAFAVTALLGATVVAVAFASTPGPSYLSVSSWKAASKSKGTAVLSVTTTASIPVHPNTFIRSNPVVGFAWVDTQTSSAFVATIHPAIGRDSNQNPRAWHGHTVTLTTGATSPDDFCLGSIASTPTVGLSIHGATMKINVRKSRLPVATTAFDLATGFTVQVDHACTSGLGVRAST